MTIERKRRNNITNVFIRTLRGLKIITTILLNHLMGHLCYSLANITLFFAKSLFQATRPSSRPGPNRLFSCARAVLLAVVLSLLNQSIIYYCPWRDSTLIPRRHTSSSRIYIEKYLQSKYTVSMPEKISICLNRGREESVGNDDVSIVCARKYEMVRMT